MKTLSEALGIEHEGTSSYSEDEVEHIFSNYRTYGGGGAGQLNGFYGKKHTEETKLLLREMKRDYKPWNIGIKGYSVHTEQSKNLMSEKLSGSKNGRALLTEHKVLEIIKTYISRPDMEGVGEIQGNGLPMSYDWAFCNMMSDQYGITAAAVKRIIRKQSWKNVWSEYESQNKN